jgi:lipid A 4'-phosphatase
LVVALAVAAVVGVVFGLWPELDLKLAALFFDPDHGGFWRAFNPDYGRVRDAVTWAVTLIAMPAIVALAGKLLWPDRPLRIPGRAILLMLVTLALGPGLLTNAVLKEHWGRPRPIDVTQFGGDEHFRPWWDPRGDCPKNCSFVSGDVSGAFWTLAPAVVLPPQWRTLGVAAALAVGAGTGALRMAAGAHFFSDVAFAGVFPFLVIWLSHGWLYRWRATRLTDAAVEQALERVRRVGKGA